MFLAILVHSFSHSRFHFFRTDEDIAFARRLDDHVMPVWLLRVRDMYSTMSPSPYTKKDNFEIPMGHDANSCDGSSQRINTENNCLMHPTYNSIFLITSSPYSDQVRKRALSSAPLQ